MWSQPLFTPISLFERCGTPQEDGVRSDIVSSQAEVETTQPQNGTATPVPEATYDCTEHSQSSPEEAELEEAELEEACKPLGQVAQTRREINDNMDLTSCLLGIEPNLAHRIMTSAQATSSLTRTSDEPPPYPQFIQGECYLAKYAWRQLVLQFMERRVRELEEKLQSLLDARHREETMSQLPDVDAAPSTLEPAQPRTIEVVELAQPEPETTITELSDNDSLVLQSADSSFETRRESPSSSEEQWAVEVLSRTESSGPDEEEEETNKVSTKSENVPLDDGITASSEQLLDDTSTRDECDIPSKPVERDGEDDGPANKSKRKRSKKTRKKKPDGDVASKVFPSLEVQVEDFAQTFKHQRAMVQVRPVIRGAFDFPLPDAPEEEKRKERLTLWFYFAAFWAIFFCARCGWQYCVGNVVTYAL
jgi:hypothetical protein